MEPKLQSVLKLTDVPSESPQGSAHDEKSPHEPLRERVSSLRLPPETIPRGSLWGKWLGGSVLIFLGIAGTLSFQHFQTRTESNRADSSIDSTEGTVASASNRSESSPGKKGMDSAETADSGNTVLEAKGYIIPAQRILVSPKVPGMIIKLNFLEGQRVKAGQVLAELEAVDYQAERDRAAAMLKAAEEHLDDLIKGPRINEILQAEATLAETQAEFEKVKLDLPRDTKLFEKRAVTEDTLQETRSRYNTLKNRVEKLTHALNLLKEGTREKQIEVARAEVIQAKAELLKAEWRLSNCKILAPITGTILKKNAEEGNIVNPIAFNGSFSLCDLANLADLEVELLIEERNISRIFKDQQCLIRSEAYPDREYRGYVSRLMPIADRAKGAIPVRVKVTVPPEEEGVYLIPEMSTVVSFLNSKKT